MAPKSYSEAIIGGTDTMARAQLNPTGKERFFDDDDLIVSKTDRQGRLTYANRVFREIADYDETEVIGQPHSLIRHPDMPRCVFRLLWERIQAGQEIFAYVCNLTKRGDHYWVLAHVTPTVDANGAIVGFHSNRRVPDRNAVAAARDLYAKLRQAEQAHTDREQAVAAGTAALQSILDQAGVTYDEWVFSLMQ